MGETTGSCGASASPGRGDERERIEAMERDDLLACAQESINATLLLMAEPYSEERKREVTRTSLNLGAAAHRHREVLLSALRGESSPPRAEGRDALDLLRGVATQVRARCDHLCAEDYRPRGRHSPDCLYDDVDVDAIEAALRASPVASRASPVARESVLREAARLVCPECGGRVYPMDRSVRVVHGPNEAGNYTHHVSPNLETLCQASSIYAQIAWDARDGAS